jgi:hypothetical protein
MSTSFACTAVLTQLLCSTENVPCMLLLVMLNAVALCRYTLTCTHQHNVMQAAAAVLQ